MAEQGPNAVKLIFDCRATGKRYSAAAIFDAQREVVICDFLCGDARLGRLHSTKLFEEYGSSTEAFKQHLKKFLEKYHDLKHCDGPCNG